VASRETKKDYSVCELPLAPVVKHEVLITEM